MSDSAGSGVSFSTFRRLEKPEWLVHGYSHRGGGVSTGPYRSLNLGTRVGDEPRLVAENRERFLKALGLELGPVVAPRQVHGARVLVVRDGTERGEADAVVCATPGIPVMVLGADCPLVLLLDVHRRAFGVVHSGRRSTTAHIVSRTLDAMKRHFGTRAQDVAAGIGPAIQGGCYEVDETAALPFQEAFGGRFVERRAERFFLDLPAAVSDELARDGVSRIEVLKRCTHCEERVFFSYRRDGKPTGRMGLLACLKGDRVPPHRKPR